MKLLHLDSSVQAENSASRALSAAIVARFSALDPMIEVAYRDLAADPLPHLTLDRFASDDGQAVLERFLGADIVVIGAPMYNFAIPTQLKAWFDHILVAGRTFRYGAEGVEGLVGGKRVIIAASRGGLYGEGSPTATFEHAERHVRAMLGFVGVTDLDVIVAEGVAFGPDQREAALAAALDRIAVIAPAPLAA